MNASTGSVPGRIFMSYRREETAPYAGWLYDRLATHFSRNQIFKDDADSIELGDDFVEVINNAVGSCDVLLALIGDRWLRIADQDGQRRLDNPDDFVRLEIEAALARNVRVIPILVEGARMPRADELPESLAKLARKQALELSPSRFDFDTQRLLRVLDRTITQTQEQARQEAGAHEPADDPLTEPGAAAPRPPQPELASPTIAVDPGSAEAATAGQSVSALETSAAAWRRQQDPASVPLVTADAPSPGAEAASAQRNPPSADVEMLPSVDRRPTQRLRLPSKTMRIGRAPDNDLVLGDDLEASPHHAELRRSPAGTYEIVDLDSHTGTFVNGHWVTRQMLTEQDIVSIGHTTFRLAGDELRQFVDEGEVSFTAHDLVVRVSGGKILLDHVSFPVPERCLLGVIGPSGAGKSVLLGALTGMPPADTGTVLYDNRDLYRHYAELRYRIGLVPQESVLHTRLTARRALQYSAELRFPADTSAAVMRSVVRVHAAGVSRRWLSRGRECLTGGLRMSGGREGPRQAKDGSEESCETARAVA